MKKRHVQFVGSLAEYRDQVLGLSQKEVAYKAGVSPNMISLLESGRVPKRHRVMLKYAVAYGLGRSLFEFLEMARSVKCIP